MRDLVPAEFLPNAPGEGPLRDLSSDHFTKQTFAGILRSSLVGQGLILAELPRNEAQDVLRVRWPRIGPRKST